MILHRLGLIHKNQRGFTLIEVLVAVAITGLIAGGIATTIYQIFGINTLSNNHMLAIRQVQNAGYWVSHDTQMAQSIDVSYDSFTITAAAATDVATITIPLTSGSISVVLSGAGTWTPATGVIAFAAIGEKTVVTATVNTTTGTWAQTTGSPTAAITTDADDDASVDATGGDFSLPDAATGQTQILSLTWVGWERIEEQGGNQLLCIDTYEVYYTYDSASGKLWRYQRITTNKYDNNGDLVETTYSPGPTVNDDWGTTFIAEYITSMGSPYWDGNKLVVTIEAAVGDAIETRTYEITPRPSSQ